MKEFWHLSTDNFDSEKEILEPEIKDSLDRKNRQPLGNLPEDEDDELVNQNDPRKRFKTENDLVDDSYLTFGERESEDEVEDDLVDEGEEGRELDLPNGLVSELKKYSVNNKDLEKEQSMNLINNLEKDLKKIALKDPELEEASAFSNKKESRAMGGKVKLDEVKTIKRYNLKTEPENKKQRRLRAETREFLDDNKK